MIDIYGTGPYLDITELLLGSLQELGIFFFHFFFILAVILLLKCFLSDNIMLISSLFILIAQIVYVWTQSTKSEFLFALFFAIIITVQVKILELYPFGKYDYTFLFSVMLFPSKLFNNTSALIGNLWIFWILFCTIYITAKIGMRKLSGNHFICYFLFIILSLSAYFYHVAGIFLIPLFTKWFGNYAFGVLCEIGVFSAVVLFAAIFIKYKFYSKLIRLNQFGKKYNKIERYFFIISFIVLIMISLIMLIFSIFQQHNGLIMLLIPCLCLSLLWFQMPFVILLFRAAFYKDTATFHEWEKEGIASYYQQLSSNLITIQEIRHDIKNIFFTMGNFVDRSDDKEMKDFFWEKIYPYSMQTIKQSELLSKLYQLPNESLRAFFNLKLLQALNRKIKVSLEIDIVLKDFQTGIDIIDLTRILGILLDNAIEETAIIPDGFIMVKVSGNDTGCSYIIKNTITFQTQTKGIEAGKSDKGKGRGKGLMIVKQLLDQYTNAALNSFIQDHIYVQSLNILFGKQNGLLD